MGIGTPFTMSLPVEEDVLAILDELSPGRARGKKSFQEALRIKEEGNKHFRRKQNSRAFVCYTEVIVLLHLIMLLFVPYYDRYDFPFIILGNPICTLASD